MRKIYSFTGSFQGVFFYQNIDYNVQTNNIVTVDKNQSK